jgi:hypothetical protein
LKSLAMVCSCPAVVISSFDPSKLEGVASARSFTKIFEIRCNRWLVAVTLWEIPFGSRRGILLPCCLEPWAYHPHFRYLQSFWKFAYPRRSFKGADVALLPRHSRSVAQQASFTISQNPTSNPF